MTTTPTTCVAQGWTPPAAHPTALACILARLVGAIAAEYRSRRKLRELTTMSDHLLRDIGLVRVRSVRVAQFGPFE